MRGRRTAVLLATALACLGAAPAIGASSGGPAAQDTYVVEAASAAQVTAALADVGARPDDVFGQLGSATADLTAEQAGRLDALPGVDVSVDPPATLADDQLGPTWGLDRMDQDRAGQDSHFRYPATGGTGVMVYVVDTGVSPLADFGGRVTTGYSVLAGDPDANLDQNSHGTHVAGTIASNTFGLAKHATIVPIKVFPASGQGSGSDIVAGLNWILAHHPAGTPGVVNLSLEVASVWSPLNNAVKALTDKGLFVAVAAGNEDVDACTTSPASAPSAFTTGAVTNADARSSFSNWGACLDGFAPGSNISSWAPNGDVAIKSGTSMAAPHVAGAAALALAQDPTITPARLSTALVAASSATVTDAGAGSPSTVVNTLALPTVGTPTGVQLTDVTTTSATATWNAPAPATPVTVASYTVTATAAGKPTVTATVAGTQTSAALTGLAWSTGYTVTVAAHALTHTGPASTAAQVTTATPVPGVPSGVQVTAAARSAALTWTAPAPVTGAAVTGYGVAWRPVGGSTWSTSSVTTTSATLADLLPETTYQATVTARAGAVAGSPSAVVEFTTPMAPPPAPAGLSAAATARDATLTWDAVPGADGYVLSWRLSGAQAWTTVRTAGTSLSLGDLAPATSYEMRIGATSAAGDGPPGPTLVVTTAFLPPAAPEALRAVLVADSSITWTWAEGLAQGAAVPTAFELQWRPVGAVEWTTVATSQPVLTLTGLLPSTAYEVQVRATTPDQPGAYGDMTVATTHASASAWTDGGSAASGRVVVPRGLPGAATLVVARS